MRLGALKRIYVIETPYEPLDEAFELLEDHGIRIWCLVCL